MEQQQRPHVGLTPDRRRALEDLAGDALAGGMQGPFVVGVNSPEPGQRGVYVVFDPLGACAYVGKAFTLQDSRRVKGRIATHIRDLRKRDAFATYHLIPLKNSTSNRRVEMVEGWVARHLNPYMGNAHPDPMARPK